MPTMKQSPLPMRIGLSMRVVRETRYPETRDALAWDWRRFLARALPDVPWVPVPNLGPGVARFLEDWGIRGLALTGGDDLGAEPQRDATERAMLDWALARACPVLGVCRGLQLLQAHGHGRLTPDAGPAHLSARHVVNFLTSPYGPAGRQETNSCHAWRIPPGELARDLLPLALAEDGSVEAARHASAPVVGVMWHPERETSPAAMDLAIVRTLFLGSAACP